MRTINQINNFTNTNPTARYYMDLCKRHDRRETGRQFQHYNGRGRGRYTPFGHDIYINLEKQFSLFVAGSMKRFLDYYEKSRSVYEYYPEYDITIHAKLEMDIINGVYLHITEVVWGDYTSPLTMTDTERKYVYRWTGFDRGKYNVLDVKSNSDFQNFNARDYLLKNYIRKNFCAPGLFLRVQQYKNIKKEAVVQEYRKMKSELDTRKFLPEEIEKGIWNRLKRHYNIQGDPLDYTQKQIKHFLFNEAKHQKTRKILMKGQSVFEIHEAYTSEYDDDENMESFFYSYIDSEYPANALFYL